MECELGHAAATLDLGERVGRAIVKVLAADAGDRRQGLLILIDGPLGAGKTTFVQGLAVGLGAAGNPTSPSFVLARSHAAAAPSGLALLHADLYRLPVDAAVADLGLDEALEHGSVVAVEWSTRVASLAARPEWLAVSIAVAGEAATPGADELRRVLLVARGPRPAAVLQELGG